MEYDLSASHTFSKSASRENKTVSLSIEDLMSDPYAGGGNRPPVPDSEPIDYKNELAKLLAKSRGTAYEKTLKRFVETKYREIQMDESERTRKALAGQLDLASLSTSKYDSPRKGSILEDSVLNSNRKSKIDEMSKPLERNVWKGPEIPANLTSTNLIGRQRPSPMKDAPFAIHTDSNSLHVSGVNSVVTRAGPSPDRRKSSGRRTRSRSPQVRAAAALAAPAALSVSTSEFNNWLDQNRQWQKKQQDKIERERRRFEKRISEGAKPKLHPKSVRLAAEANERENRRIIEEVEARNQQLQALWEQQREEQREQEVDLLSEFDLPLDEQQDEDGRSLCSASTAAPAPPPLSPSSLTVYDRLAARGRSHAEKRLNWEPPDDDQPHRPVILEASLRMLRNRTTSYESPHRRASPSPSSSRRFLTGSGMSKVFAAAAAFSESGASTAAVPPATPSVVEEGKTRSDSKLTVQSTSDTVHSFVVTNSSLKLSDLLMQAAAEELRTEELEGMREGRSVGRESRSQRSRSSSRLREMTSAERGGLSGTSTGSVYGGGVSLSGAELRMLAQAGIERSRSLSASRRQREKDRESRRNYTSLEVVRQPFAPLLVSGAASPKVKSTFVERNLQSADVRFIRNVISKRAGSPGPGYYSNLNASNVLSPCRVRPSSCSPSRASGLSVVRDASPGHRGYSFNREPLTRLMTQQGQQTDGKLAGLMDTLNEMGSSLRMRISSSEKRMEISTDL